MITVKDLEMICERIGREHGHDSKVCIKIYDDEDNFREADYARCLEVSNDGTLYISNQMKG